MKAPKAMSTCITLTAGPSKVRCAAERLKTVLREGQPTNFANSRPLDTAVEDVNNYNISLVQQAASHSTSIEILQEKVQALQRDNLALRARLDQQDQLIGMLGARREQVVLGGVDPASGKLEHDEFLARAKQRDYDNTRCHVSSTYISEQPKQDLSHHQSPSEVLQGVIQELEGPKSHLELMQGHLVVKMSKPELRTHWQGRIFADLLHRHAEQEESLRRAIDRLSELKRRIAAAENEHIYLLTIAGGIEKFRSKVANRLHLGAWPTLREQLENGNTWIRDKQIRELLQKSGIDISIWRHLEEIQNQRNQRCHPVGRGVSALWYHSYAVRQEPPPGLGIDQKQVIRAMEWTAVEEGDSPVPSPRNKLAYCSNPWQVQQKQAREDQYF